MIDPVIEQVQCRSEQALRSKRLPELLAHYSKEEILAAIEHLGPEKLLYPIEELWEEFR